MVKNTYQLVLASQSPRRQELLKTLFLPFRIEVADIEEVSECEKPSDIVEDLALQKANHIFKRLDKNPLVIGADTIVCLQEEILGKPRSRDEARQMLQKLAGRSHHVFSGVGLVSKQKSESFHIQTEVTFGDIPTDLMELYLDTGESMDKAGAYGIQSYALSFIKEIDGSYSNVVGLPVDQLLLRIKEHISQDDSLENWRDIFDSN